MEFDRIKMTWISWIKHQSSQEGRHHQAYQLSTINTTAQPQPSTLSIFFLLGFLVWREKTTLKSELRA
jgi:hypothetical protein